MKKPVVVLVLFLYVSAVFGADDATDNPTTTAPTDESNDDSIVTEANIIPEVQNSDTVSSAIDESPNSHDETSDAVIEVTEDASKNDLDETESSTNQNSEVDTATAEVSGTTENAETSTNQNNEGNEDLSTTSINEESSTSASTEPSSEEPAFSCSQNGVGRYARPGNCHDYYYCWDTIHEYVTFSCKSKVFDPIIKQCVNNWAHCDSTPKCSEDRQVLADPDDINAFFVCKSPPGPLNPGFIVQKEKCHGEREFDVQLGYCKEVITEPTSSSESEESKEKFECNAVGIFADINDETKYFECKLKSVSKGKLKLHHHSCPKYHVFSLEDMLCIPVQ